MKPLDEDVRGSCPLAPPLGGAGVGSCFDQQPEAALRSRGQRDTSTEPHPEEGVHVPPSPTTLSASVMRQQLLILLSASCVTQPVGPWVLCRPLGSL